MATVKVFDEKSGKWISVVSNNANGILSESTDLVNLVNDTRDPHPKKTTVNIEDVLECVSSKIKTLSGNISWLANFVGVSKLPPSSESDTVFITVNEVRRESITGVLIRGEEELTVVIRGFGSMPNLDLIALSGNKVIKKVRDARPNSPIKITQDDLLEAEIPLNKDFNLEVVARSPETNATIYWTGTIFVI